MNSKKVSKAVVSLLRERGGEWTTCSKSIYRELLRAAPVNGADKRTMEEAVRGCVQSGKIKRVRRGDTHGLKLIN